MLNATFGYNVVDAHCHVAESIQQIMSNSHGIYVKSYPKGDE